MSYGCHRRERAEEFRRSNYVSHIPKGRLKKEEATHFIQKVESFFQGLEEARNHNGRGYVELRKSFRDVKVEFLGNHQSGSIVVRGGLNQYSEIHFSPRAIHVYHSEQEDSLSNEAAIYLNRYLPHESLGYGSKRQLERLMKEF